jgi:hypothetical protein
MAKALAEPERQPMPNAERCAEHEPVSDSYAALRTADADTEHGTVAKPFHFSVSDAYAKRKPIAEPCSFSFPEPEHEPISDAERRTVAFIQGGHDILHIRRQLEVSARHSCSDA